MPGDWSVRRPDLAPGGWAFEFDNDNYPDVDDTSEVVLALRRVAHPDAGGGRRRHRPRRGLDGRHAVPRRRLGRVRRRQHPRPVPAAAVLRLRRGDRPAQRRRHRPHGRDARPARPRRRAALDRGVEWLWRAQEADGSWFGRWGANHVYGTGAAVPALVAAGVGARRSPSAARRRLAGRPPERRRRLGRGPAQLRRRRLAGSGPLDAVADGVGPARPARRRRPGRGHRAGRGLPGRRASAPTAPGTSPSTPAPASPATSTSTTTCTGRSSRCMALGRYVRGGPCA